MPSEVETETDSEREQTYKRGYAHGVAASISAFVDKLSKADNDKIDDWYRKVLVPWMEDAEARVRAPDFPVI